MKAFDKLPAPFQTDEVRPYYEALQKKTGARVAKRVFDIIVALIMLVFLILPILVIAVIVKATSPDMYFSVRSASLPMAGISESLNSALWWKTPRRSAHRSPPTLTAA